MNTTVRLKIGGSTHDSIMLWMMIDLSEKQLMFYVRSNGETTEHETIEAAIEEYNKHMRRQFEDRYPFLTIDDFYKCVYWEKI